MHKICGALLSLYPGELGECVYVRTDASCCLVFNSEHMGKCQLPSREEWLHKGGIAQLKVKKKSESVF